MDDLKKKFEKVKARDYRLIKETALQHFRDDRVPNGESDEFVAKCYFKAVVAFLEQEGYFKTKGEKSE